MQITNDIIHDSVAQRPFGAFEPFVTGTDADASLFYSDILSALERVPGVAVLREREHHGSGYASYVSAFLYPSDGSTCRDHPDCTEIIGILLYLSRLAPIAVYGASNRTENKDGKSSSSGFIYANNVGTLPDGDWEAVIAAVTACLGAFRIEILSRESLLHPAPEGIDIPTVFDGPYFIYDALFYWRD